MPNATTIGQSPTSWGAAINYDIWNDPYRQKDKAILHWLGGWNYDGKTGPELLRMAERWHLNKGWRGLAYGWAINPTDAQVFRVRGLNGYGAHKGDLDGDGIAENVEGIPILVLTGQGGPTLTEAATNRLRALIADLAALVGRDRLAVYGHRDVALMGWGTGTECPGNTIHQLATRLRTETLPPPEETDVTYRTLAVHLRDGKPTYEAYKTDKELRLHCQHGQSMLVNVGFVSANTFTAGEPPDGLYGPGTRTAVQAFQRARGLTVDGIVSALTWAELARP